MKRLSFPLLVLLLMLPLLQLAAPVSAQVAVVGDLARDYDVSPGAVVTGTIAVQNPTDLPRQAKIYQTDYAFFLDGSNFFDEPNTLARSNADWIVFNPSSVTVPPGEQVEIAYRLSVPEDSASLSGSYWSVIMVEDVPADAPESTMDSSLEEVQVGLRQVYRYAVQIAAHVRDIEEYQIAFAGVDLEAGSSGRLLRVGVENEGNVLVKPKVWIEVFDGAGENLGKRDSEVARIYPETSVSYRFDLSDLAQGDYEVLVVVDAGEDNLFGGQYTVTL